jgi:uncharacterized protein (DUF433 family)
MTTTSSSHIVLDPRGVAWIDDTNVKVIEVALDRIAHGSSPEEIFDQHAPTLSMAQIHAALAWYYDHQEVIDAEISRQVENFERLRAAQRTSPGRERLARMQALRSPVDPPE